MNYSRLDRRFTFLLSAALFTGVVGSRVLAQPATTPGTPPTGQPAPDTPPSTPANPPAAPTDGGTTGSTTSDVERSTQAYNAGLAALKKGDWETAAARFGEVTAISPRDAGAQMLLGYAQLKAGHFADAVTALQAASDNASTLDVHSRVEVQNNLGIALWNSDHKDDAIAAYRKAIALDSKFTEARYNLAFALLSLNRASEALPQLVILSQANPTDGTLQDAIGEAYEAMGNPAKALGAYSKAAQLLPQSAPAQLRLAIALLTSKRDSEAIAALRKAIQLDSNLAPAFGRLGALLLDHGRYKEAQEVLSRYVSLAPTDFTGWYNLGVARDYQSDFDKALEAYTQAEKLNPTDPAVKNNIGRIYFKRKDYEQAITKTREALALDPKYLYARHNLALAMTASDDRAGAIKEWQVLLTFARDQIVACKDPVRKRDLQQLASAARAAIAENYLALKDYPNAIQQYEQLLKQTPNNLAAMSNYGLALYHAERYPDAEKIYRQIVTRDPKNAIAHNNLGVMLEAQGKKTEALEQYRLALKLKADYSEAQANIARLTQTTRMG